MATMAERRAAILAAIPDEHKPALSCGNCPFGGPRVGSKGNPSAEVVFVAESPGQEECAQYVPLVGTSGQVFHTFVPQGDEFYILNALECYPKKRLKTEPKMNLAASCCKARLIEKISAHPRRLIIAMGNAALRSLTGDMTLKITQNRGQLIPSPYSELGIMPIIHMAALLYGTGSFRQWKNDVAYALELGRGASPRPHLKAKVIRADANASIAAIRTFIADVRAKHMTSSWTCDIETSGFDHRQDYILSVGMTPADDPSVSYAFPPALIYMLKGWLEDRSIKWSWHNGKFDVKFFHTIGIDARVDDDTMLLSYAQDETRGIHDLETLSTDLLGAPSYKDMIQPYLPNKKASYELIPYSVLTEYQAIDTSNTAQDLAILKPRIMADAKMSKLYTKTLMPVQEMLTQVEERGVFIDQNRLDENELYFHGGTNEDGEEVTGIMQKAKAAIVDLYGREINPNSPKQVSHMLFKHYKFKNYRKGSTDEDALTRLQKETEHPIFGLILEHRKANKMYGTYVKGWRKWIQPDTGRIHSTYLVHGSVTGRLASRDPNLQNPPRDAQIRGAIRAALGYELIEIDLSQAELRSLAHLSQCPVLCQVFLSGGDLHSDLAEFLFPGYKQRANSDDPVVRAVAKEQRVKCKNVNFGIVYGITKFGLYEQIGGTLEECSRLINGWYKRYKVAGEFINKCRECPGKNIIIGTPFGRQKRVGLVSRANIGFLENEAANFPHQSIANDITLHAGVKSYKQLPKWDAHIINLVHDSLLIESPITKNNTVRDKVIKYVSANFAEVTQEWNLTRVPFKTDAEVGDRWGSLIDVNKLREQEAANPPKVEYCENCKMAGCKGGWSCLGAF